MKSAMGEQREVPTQLAQGQTDPREAPGVDLMQLSAVQRLVLWAGFPGVFQGMMLAVMIVLIVIAWGLVTPPGINDKLYARTNLATLLVWGLWWPAIIWTSVWLGRAWCVVCPLELVGSLSERAAGYAGLRGRPLPRWVAAGGVIFVLYLALQMLVPGVHLHRVPAFTAYFLASLIALAVVGGVVYRDRAICRGFCPVGLLLGTYGRGSMLAVRAGRVEGKSVISGPDARSCPSLLNPSRLNSNAECLGCVHCYKHAAPGSMRLLLRRPFAAGDQRERLASWPVTGFVMVASGFVISELCSEWSAAKKLFLAVPEWATAELGWKSMSGWMEGLWTLVAVPLALWLVLAGLLRLAGEKETWPNLVRRLALPLAVVVAAGHMSKALAKFVSWVQFLPGAWQDPAGVVTARAISAKVAPSPAPVLGLSAVSWIALGLIMVAAVVAVREYRLAQRRQEIVPPSVWPIAFLASGFAALVAGWR